MASLGVAKQGGDAIGGWRRGAIASETEGRGQRCRHGLELAASAECGVRSPAAA
ncbi:MAG TPA: hypothetical protein VFN82_06815 [Solirubrobacterales bacterium]|nr:hypothetical protein [Solirubrobacterales bacterium]